VIEELLKEEKQFLQSTFTAVSQKLKFYKLKPFFVWNIVDLHKAIVNKWNFVVCSFFISTEEVDQCHSWSVALCNNDHFFLKNLHHNKFIFNTNDQLQKFTCLEEDIQNWRVETSKLYTSVELPGIYQNTIKQAENLKIHKQIFKE
jgi:hypothetical protein